MAPRISHTADISPDVAGPRLVMLLCVLGLTLLGFVMIFSASSISAITEEGNSTSYLVDQLVFAVLGIAAAFALYFAVTTWGVQTFENLS